MSVTRVIGNLIQVLGIFTMVMAVNTHLLAQESQPHLHIYKNADQKNVVAGGLINFQIEPQVHRTPTATNVVVTDVIPEHTSFVSATGGGTHDPQTNTVTWNLPLLVEGEEPKFELIVRVDNPTAASRVDNTASMTSDEGLDETGQETASDFVNIRSAPFIVVTKTANATLVKPGDEVSFNIEYLNDGNKAADGAVLYDVLPPFTSFVDSTQGGVYDAGTNTVTWPAQDVDEGTGGELVLIVSIDADAPDSTVITNSAIMTGDNFEDAVGSAQVTVQSAPILQLVKIADVDFAGPGQNITYELQFSNTGNVSATDLVLEDTVPVNTSFVSATGGGVFDGTKVTWNQADLFPGESGSVSMTVKVSTSVVLSTKTVSGDVITNIAALNSSNASPVFAELRIPIVAAPLLEISKTANAEFIKAGTNVIYTLHYENNGTATAENVVLEDIIPENTTFVTATGGGQLIGDRVVWTDTGLDPGAVGQVQLVLLVGDLLPEGTQVINTASMTSDNSSPVADSAIITVRNSPILQISKNANVDYIQSGDQIVYAIEFTNVGNVDAESVTIEDLLPADTTFLSASGGGTFTSDRVIWSFPYLGVGQVGSVNLVVGVGVIEGETTIRNNVTIDSANALPASGYHEVSNRLAPVLILEKDAGKDFVDAGGQVTYTLQFTNIGNAPATNIALQDYLPELTNFISASGGGIYNEAERVVTWTISSLAVGATSQVQLTLQIDESAPQGSVIINSSTIQSDDSTPLTDSESIIVKLSPKLQLDKTADVKIVSPGDLVTYTLQYANTGNTTASDPVLEDAIPRGATFVSATGGGVFSGNSVRWSLPYLAVGEQGSVSLVVAVNGDVANGDYIDNVATLDSPDAFAVSASDEVLVSLLPRLGITKTTGNEFVEAGEQLTFSLVYENTGNAAATNVVLTDEIPAGTQFVSATGGGVLTGNVVTWTDPVLEVGAVGEVQLTLQVSELAEDDSTIFNSATLISAENPPVTDFAAVTIRRTPLLGLVKTASVELVGPGEEVTFTMDFSNTGNATAVDLVLEDAVPANTAFVSATGGGVLADGVVKWTGTQLAAGESGAVAMTVRVDPLADDELVILNTATFGSANASPVTSDVSVVVQKRPILALTKTANADFVEAGEVADFTLEFTNIGNDSASNLRIEDFIPAGTSFSSASSGGTYDPVSNKVSWSFASLAVGEVSQVTLAVRVDGAIEDATVIQNSATLTSDLVQPVTASDSIIVKRSPALVLAKDSNVVFIGPGEQLTYDIEIDNQGNAEALDVVLEDPIPANTSYVSSTGGGVFAEGKVTWTISSLPVNSPANVSMTVLVDPAAILDDIKSVEDGTIIHNTATLDSSNAYPVSAEDSVVVKFSPALSIVKSADKTVAIPGERITYILSIENTGNVSATNVVLEDTLPDDVIFISASDNGLENAGIVTWTLDSLAVGASAEFSLIVEVESPLENGTTIHNSSSLHSDQTPPVSADHTLNVQSKPLLSLGKSADKSVVVPGDQITYSLLIKNTGNANSSGLVVDEIPDHTTFVSASNGGLEINGKVNWYLPNILVGAPQTVTLTVLVDTPLDDGTLIYNKASLDAVQHAPLVADHSLYVQSSPVLTLSKGVDFEVASPGTELIYTLHYANEGNANATNTYLRDQVPAHTSFVSASDGGDEFNGLVTWDLGLLAAGASGTVSLTVLVDTPLDDETLIFNLASLESDQASPAIDSARTTIQSAPRMVLNKRADNPLVEAGGQIVYTLEYANTGNANATGVTLTDWLPAHTSFVSASDGGTESGGLVSWPLADLPAGASGSVSLTVAVDNPLDNATRIFNIASLDSAEGQPDISTALVVVQSAPVLSLVKTANVSLAQPGDLVTYTMTFGNIGNANAINYVLSDAIPFNTSFVSASGGGIHSGGVVTWSGTDLLAGDSHSVTLVVQIGSPLDDGVVIDNQATLVADRADAVDSSVAVTIQSSPVISLNKTASAALVQPGDLLTYTLGFENTGNANATGVVLEDIVPANTDFVSASGGGLESGGIVTWPETGLPVGVPGSVTMTVQVKSPLTDGTVITNAASIISDQTTEVNDEVTVTVQSSPILELSKTADRIVAIPGELLTYSLSLYNSGNANASNVMLLDTLPDNTVFVSATGGGTESGGVVSWTAAELPVGIVASVSLTVSVNQPLDNGTPVVNTASLYSDQTDPVNASLTLNVQSSPVLSLVKTADKPVVNPGEQISYTLSFSNAGNANANNVVLEDTLPANTTFVSTTGGGTENGGIVTWAIPELAVGPGGSVTLTVLVDSPLDNGTSIYNSATLDSNETAPVSADHTLAVQSMPVLTLEKTADKSVVIPGDLISYRIDFANTGDADASDVTLVDQLPADTSFVSATGGGVESAGTVVWPFFQIPAGSGGSVVVVVSVNSPLEDATTLHNTVSLGDGTSAPVTAFADVIVQSAPVPVINKSADVTFVQEGEQINYTIDYSNTGTAILQGAVLTDELPANTRFISASDGGVFDGVGVSWNIGGLNPATGGTVTLAVQVEGTVNDGDIISNVGSLTSTNAQPVADVVSVTVLGSAILEITKTAGVENVLAGEQVEYTISVTNSGNTTATGLVIEDAIPSLSEFVAASDGGSLENGVVTWQLADLPPGSVSLVTLTVRVSLAAPVGASITNTASVVSDDTPPVSASSVLLVYDPVEGNPVLRIQVTPDVASITPGQQIDYSVDFINTTEVAAEDVTVLAFLPRNVVFVSASDGGILESNGSEYWVRWDLASLAGQEAGQVRYRVRHPGDTLLEQNRSFLTSVETIRALVSIWAENALPGSIDFDEATVLVIRVPVLPVGALPVPIAGPFGLLLMSLLLLGIGLAGINRKGIKQ